uniref:Uncharacterized protein n=1 Tax=Apteryx owenii TaxID=8824 RepID=A0A8B9QBG9_APTOW
MRAAALPITLLLAWALLGPGGAQQCPSAGAVLRFADTHADIRVPALHRLPGALDPLYGLVRRCLDLVQQNPLPAGEPGRGDPQGGIPTGRDIRGEERQAQDGRAAGRGHRSGPAVSSCRAAPGSPERPGLREDIPGELAERGFPGAETVGMGWDGTCQLARSAG